jgi:hypothetical protein
VTEPHHDGVVATFLDGPLAQVASDRRLNIPQPPYSLWFAPQGTPPDEQDPPATADRWMLVAATAPPEWPLPGQVRYDLQDLDTEAAGEHAVATYRQHDELLMYAVFERPDDFPDGFLVRAFAVERPAGETAAPRPLGAMPAPDLEKARMHVPDGLVRIDHQPGDDAKLVETWL